MFRPLRTNKVPLVHKTPTRRKSTGSLFGLASWRPCPSRIKKVSTPKVVSTEVDRSSLYSVKKKAMMR